MIAVVDVVAVAVVVDKEEAILFVFVLVLFPVVATIPLELDFLNDDGGCVTTSVDLVVASDTATAAANDDGTTIAIDVDVDVESTHNKVWIYRHCS
mmetsp:Transcript_57528/g.62141  ORF Transcript_57528/g.62141 Transcript_57528/m.62141 type:complete len:96 (-) Transcript_57528:178-465(-)